jgi:hypothetical protein
LEKNKDIALYGIILPVKKRDSHANLLAIITSLNSSLKICLYETIQGISYAYQVVSSLIICK